MHRQYNLATKGMNSREISNTDKMFTDKGWKVIGTSTVMPEHFRTYQWEHSDLDPDFPDEYKPTESQLEPIDLQHFAVGNSRE